MELNREEDVHRLRHCPLVVIPPLIEPLPELLWLAAGAVSIFELFVEFCVTACEGK